MSDLIGRLGNFRQDIVYAGRGMRENPVFAATAILILALGIGGTTAMFTVIRAVLLKPLGYPEPQQLVQISGGATPARFAEIQADARSFHGVGAYSGEETVTLGGAKEPEVLNAIRVSSGFLQILGVAPILGRGFASTEDAPGGAPVVMISAELWERRFHRDPHVDGEQVVLGAAPYTIIGVLPPRFAFPEAGIDAWLTKPTEWPLMEAKSRLLSPFLNVFGRLKPGVDLKQARAEMAVIQHHYAAAHPAMLDARSTEAAEMSLLKDQLVTGIRSTLVMLFGAVGLVLLIGCANVAGLLLARSSSRSHEFAVRAALGAARSRLIGQLLAESVLLSCAGGLAGVVMAVLSLRAIPALTALDLPRAGEIHVDGVVLAFAAALSVGTGVLFGLAPSLAASRPDLISVLRGHGSATGGRNARKSAGGRGVGDLLVVTQIALSVVLLIGAALLMQSVARLRHVDVGFQTANLLTMKISLPPMRYDTAQKRALFFEDVLHHVAALPGVRNATAAMFLPMTGFVGSPVQDAAKARLRLNERRIATVLMVMPGYFRTLGIPMRRGRDFTEHDNAASAGVAIIDEALARRFWPGYPAGADPIGQRLLVGGVNPHPVSIIGVVPRVHQNLEDTAWPETVYTSFAQNPQQFGMLAIRTEGDPIHLARAVGAQVRAVDRDQAVSAVRTMDALLDEDVGQRGLILGLLDGFAGVALLLALMGVYGVIAYSVNQRVHELGIRWALGADRNDILALVMGQGLRLAVVGIGIGMGGALALTRVMGSLLYGVSASDPVTFAGVALLFVMAVLAAVYIPARRATRIDPMTALRD